MTASPGSSRRGSSTPRPPPQPLVPVSDPASQEAESKAQASNRGENSASQEAENEAEAEAENKSATIQLAEAEQEGGDHEPCRKRCGPPSSGRFAAFGVVSGMAPAAEPQPDLPSSGAARTDAVPSPDPRPDVPAASASAVAAEPVSPPPAKGAPPAASRSPRAPDSAEQGKAELVPGEPANAGIRGRPSVASTPASPVSRPPGEREQLASLNQSTRRESAKTGLPVPAPEARSFREQLIPKAVRAVEDGSSQLVLALSALGLAILVAGSSAFLLGVTRRSRRDLEKAG